MIYIPPPNTIINTFKVSNYEQGATWRVVYLDWKVTAFGVSHSGAEMLISFLWHYKQALQDLQTIAPSPDVIPAVIAAKILVHSSAKVVDHEEVEFLTSQLEVTRNRAGGYRD